MKRISSIALTTFAAILIPLPALAANPCFLGIERAVA
jgi:hypothetical protein